MHKSHTAIGLQIRSVLLERGEISAYDFWKYYRNDLTYDYIKSIFWILKKLGLIEPVRKEENTKKSPYGKVYYRIVHSRINDECWTSPQGCYNRIKYQY